MRIPTSFRLMGHTFTVEQIPQIRWKQSDCVGWFNPKEMKIGILKRPGTAAEQVFTHELVHAMTYVMGHSLYENEEFTDTFSGLLHQAATSAKYPKPRQPRRSRKG
jgi:hypothetical protein